MEKAGNFIEFYQKSSQRSQRTFLASQRGQRSQRKKPPMVDCWRSEIAIKNYKIYRGTYS